MRELTRAEFLRAAAVAGVGTALLGGAAAGVTGCGRQASENPRAQTPASGGASPSAAATAAGKSKLAVAKGGSASDSTARAVAVLGGMAAFVKRGDVVVVKPNICTARTPEYAATTNPEVVATLVRLAREAGAKRVIVMDNTLSDPAAAYTVSGIARAVNDAGGTMHLMARSGYRDYQVPGTLLSKHPLYTQIMQADVVISAPVAKQHGSAGLTLAGKNLMGACEDRGRMHRVGLSRSIAELAAAVRPNLAIVDATRILLRNGPTGGSLDDVARRDTVIASADWVAADAFSTGLFDLTPRDVPYIGAAAAMNLGHAARSSWAVEQV